MEMEFIVNFAISHSSYLWNPQNYETQLFSASLNDFKNLIDVI